MGAADEEIGEVRGATSQLLESLTDLSETTARAASALPGWSRAHVLAHLARNADGYRRMAEAAEVGETSEMYPGGTAQRTADIERGAARPVSEILADLRSSAEALFSTWDRLPETAWNGTGRISGTPAFGEIPISWEVGARWREIEVHRVDLDLGYTPEDWTQAFVGATLERVVANMPDRARDIPEGVSWELVATTSGRAWLVTAVSVTEGGGAAARRVRAPDHVLLAWLFCRDVPWDDPDGDRAGEEARAFARYFPFP